MRGLLKLVQGPDIHTHAVTVLAQRTEDLSPLMPIPELGTSGTTDQEPGTAAALGKSNA